MTGWGGEEGEKEKKKETGREYLLYKGINPIMRIPLLGLHLNLIMS